MEQVRGRLGKHMASHSRGHPALPISGSWWAPECERRKARLLACAIEDRIKTAIRLRTGSYSWEPRAASCL